MKPNLSSEYSNYQHDKYLELMDAGDPLDFYLFHVMLPDDVRNSLYNSFEPGFKVSNKQIVADLLNKGNEEAINISAWIIEWLDTNALDAVEEIKNDFTTVEWKHITDLLPDVYHDKFIFEDSDMATKYTAVEYFSPPFQATFINAVKPDTYGDKPKYNFRGLFPKSMDLQWYYDKVIECAKINNLLGADGKPICEYPNFGDGDATNCFHKETGEQYEGHRDHYWMKFMSSDNDGEPQPFGIIDIAEQPAQASDLYPGIFIRINSRLVPFDHPKFGLKIIQRCDHIMITGHVEPFKQTGGSIDTGRVFANAPPVTGLPAHVSQAPPQVNNTPVMTPGNGAAPQAPPQAPVGALGPSLSPEDFKHQVSNDPAPGITMGPNANNYTYEQWQASELTDDQMRAKGIIL